MILYVLAALLILLIIVILLNRERFKKFVPAVGLMGMLYMNNKPGKTAIMNTSGKTNAKDKNNGEESGNNTLKGSTGDTNAPTYSNNSRFYVV